jgi:predicted transcriptional regulator
MLKIKCKLCGKKFKDTNNKSGCLTKHMLFVHNISYNKNEKNKYFELIKSQNKNMIECEICGWKTYDVENKSGMLTIHLKRKHGVTIDEYVNKYPETKKLWKTHFTQKKREKFINLSEDNRIKCEICGRYFKKLTNSHLAKHGITPSEYKNCFNIDTTVSKTTSKVQSEITKVTNKKIIKYYKDNELVMPIHNKKSNEKKSKQCFDLYKQRISNDFVLNFTWEDFYNKRKLEFKCKKCGNIIKTKVRYPRCYKCNPLNNSDEENEINDFLKNELKLNFERNNRKILNGNEIDFYFRSENIAIEYNGLYWHSELQGKNKKYHLNKTNLALRNNIKLIHIFSDEWTDKKEIVKSRLRNLFNKNINKIYGRNCDIINLTTEKARFFFNENHTQGYINSKHKIGLLYNGEIVSAMLFGNLRSALGNKNRNKNEFELLRFANIKDTNVLGAGSKLLKHFIKEFSPKKIISYADKRWTPDPNNNFYINNGFKLTHTTQPNYWYTNKYKQRLHRFNFTKGKLVKEGFDKLKTEWEIMQELGYDRIWDCGSIKYEFVFNQS